MYVECSIHYVNFLLESLLLHIHITGIQDYCKRYGANITKVVSDEYSTPRNLSGDTLTLMSKYFNEQIPLDKVEERCQWRADYLKQLIKFKETMKKKDS